MTTDQDFTKVNPNAFLLVAVGLLLGFIGGYVARPHLRPKTSPPNVIESVNLDAEYTESFPYTFANRQEAVAWLERQIDFIQRHTYSSQHRPENLSYLQEQLAEIRTKPAAMLPIPLFHQVNTEVERLQESLTATMPSRPLPDDQPRQSDASPPRPFARPRIDD